MSWLRIPWTEAGQILARCSDDGEPGDASGAEPEAYFRELAVGGELDAAVVYLGAALPRQEAVEWALHVLDRSGRCGQTAYREQLLRAVRGWLAAPGDDRRRAAFALAQQSAEGSPERLLACAVYFSGGSIAPEDCEPVPPESHLCGRLAATAILACAYGGDDTDRILQLATAEGDRIASS